MKVIAPARLGRKRTQNPEAPEGAPSAPDPEGASAPDPEGAPSPPEPPAETPGDPHRSHTRGLLRKSAIRWFLKAEFDFPLQIREAFFTVTEAKFSEDLRRSVARARELRRNTLMAPDA
jgi:hypothetical protein